MKTPLSGRSRTPMETPPCCAFWWGTLHRGMLERPLLRCDQAGGASAGAACVVFALASPVFKADTKFAMARIERQIPGVIRECSRARMHIYVTWMNKASEADVREEAVCMAAHMCNLRDKYDALYVFAFSRAASVSKHALRDIHNVRAVILVDPPLSSDVGVSMRVQPTVVYRPVAQRGNGADVHYTFEQRNEVDNQFTPRSKPRHVRVDSAARKSRSVHMDTLFRGESPRTNAARKRTFSFFGSRVPGKAAAGETGS